MMRSVSRFLDIIIVIIILRSEVTGLYSSGVQAAAFSCWVFSLR